MMLVFSALIAADRYFGPCVPINVDPVSYAVVSHEFESTPIYSDAQSYKMYARRGGRIASEKNLNLNRKWTITK